MHYQSFNQVSEKDVIAFIRQHNFGCLVTHHQMEWHASHLMFMIDEKEGIIRLVSHLAKENPQRQHVEQGAEGTVIFTGAHTYISPKNYSTPVSVPTWNYMAVYAYGNCELLPDESKMELLSRLVEYHEKEYFDGAFKELPRSYMERMLPQLTAFRFRISRMEHRFKLSQEKPEADRQRIVEQLSSSGNSNDAEIAGAMLKFGLKLR